MEGPVLFKKLMPREPKGLEGNEVKEHNGVDSVNYFKPWCDTELVVSEI